MGKNIENHGKDEQNVAKIENHEKLDNNANTAKLNTADMLDFHNFDFGQFNPIIDELTDNWCSKLYTKPDFTGNYLMVQANFGSSTKVNMLSQHNYLFYARIRSYKVNQGCKLSLFYFETTEKWMVNPDADNSFRSLAEFDKINDGKVMGYKCFC